MAALSFLCKLNFDGSSKGNLKPSGFGCVIHDAQWALIKIVVGPIGLADSTKAEVMGLLWGLREVCSLNLSHALVEGDSAMVVGWGLGHSNCSWKYVHLIHEIMVLVVVSLNVVLSLVPRSQNGMVNKIVN